MAGLLIKPGVFSNDVCKPPRLSPKNGSDSTDFIGVSEIFEGISFISDGFAKDDDGGSPLNLRFCIPRAVCVNSFSSFSRPTEAARLCLKGRSKRPEKEPVGVGGVIESSSSYSSEDKSTSGESSRVRSGSSIESALEMDGVMIER